MKLSIYITIILVLVGMVLDPRPARAQSLDLDQIGVNLLRATTTNLNGAGIRVAQPEGPVGPQEWETDPAAIGQPASLFSYASAAGSANMFPNAVGTNSPHADYVGLIFYGIIATNVAHVDCFDASYFINAYVVSNLVVLNDRVVNQSFSFGELTGGTSQWTDAKYDDYAARFGTLFVSAAGNGGGVVDPAACYNGIAVAAYLGSSSVGPTTDNGRCKPDITAAHIETSFSAPQVSGAAALLLQAALRGDGGPATNAASDLRTIKALLLNGAVKPADWTNSSASPLDARYGAGVLNVFNAYEQLARGKHVCSASNSVAAGAAHPPLAKTNSVSAMVGWDWESLTNNSVMDVVEHYFFNVSNGLATVTLVWNRQFGKTNINNLDLFLYNCANSNLVACSTSRVDNVEHLFVPSLPAGRYDLQVLKNGGANMVSDAETYALVFAFTATPKLNLVMTETKLVLSWPAYPAGFVVEASTNLVLPGGWSDATLPASGFTNGQNTLLLDAARQTQFYRLHEP